MGTSRVVSWVGVSVDLKDQPLSRMVLGTSFFNGKETDGNRKPCRLQEQYNVASVRLYPKSGSVLKNSCIRQFLDIVDS